MVHSFNTLQSTLSLWMVLSVFLSFRITLTLLAILLGISIVRRIVKV